MGLFKKGQKSRRRRKVLKSANKCKEKYQNSNLHDNISKGRNVIHNRFLNITQETKGDMPLITDPPPTSSTTLSEENKCI